MDSIIPHYEVKELPSRFVGYPDGVRVLIAPYTAGAAMNIEMVGRTNINVFEETLDGIKVEGMPKNLLTPQDILFLGVYRNLVSSSHDKITLTSICPKCLNENKDNATLKTIKFKDIEEFDKSCYPIEVDFNDYTMHFGFVTYKDFKLCLNKFRGQKIYQLALQVVDYTDKKTGETFRKPDYNLDRKTDLIEKYATDVRHILYNLVDEDRETLEEVIDILEDYGTKPIETECQDKRCRHKYSFSINDEGVLVTPFRETVKSARARIKLRKTDIDRPDNDETNEPEGSGITGETSRETGERKEKARTKQLDSKDQIQYFTE